MFAEPCVQKPTVFTTQAVLTWFMADQNNMIMALSIEAQPQIRESDIFFIIITQMCLIPRHSYISRGQLLRIYKLSFSKHMDLV